MTIRDRVIEVARGYLRDFPQFFQTAFDPAGRTYEIAPPNIDPESLWVAFVPGAGGASAAASVTTAYDLDARNGLIRFTNPVPAGTSKILVEGYNYEWLSPADMEFYADMAIHMDTFNLGTALEDTKPAIVDLIGVHALVEALWGLVSEFSRDIDTIASESIHIQASQRYRMVTNLLDYWMAEYKKRAQALNVGLDRIEVFTLRRRSRTTERLVPVYKEREIEDYGPIERLFPEIGKGVIEIEEHDTLRDDVYVDGDPPNSYVNTGHYD